MQVKEANGSTVRLSIMSSAKAIIGRYEIFIETKHKESSGEASFFRYKHEEQICLLFNAWCSGNFVTVAVPLVKEISIHFVAGVVWNVAK